jgi:methionyl-tRNA formyltransferase
MVEAVGAVDAGTARPEPQDEARATFQGLVTDEVARIDWRRSARELDRLVRGCDPSPGAHAQSAGGLRIRLFDARLLAGEAVGAEPGTIVALDAGRMVVAARGGRLSIGKVRVADGPKGPAAAALDATGVEAGERLR